MKKEISICVVGSVIGVVLTLTLQYISAPLFKKQELEIEAKNPSAAEIAMVNMEANFKEPNASMIQILPYEGAAINEARAVAIKKQLDVTKDNLGLKYYWAPQAIAPVPAPALNTVYCTPSSATQVPMFIEFLRNHNVEVNAIYPSSQQKKNLIVLGHNRDWTDTTPVTQKEIENVTFHCSR